ncbi:unnamed protein product [Rangifer tarandus platyrhynchus]|uniref:Uncharacterized protein n=1 Tax=Rangifer tarandus platyrhynchus TaxID=3082113 RepID=A0AC59ZQX0_RANTA
MRGCSHLGGPGHTDRAHLSGLKPQECGAETTEPRPRALRMDADGLVLGFLKGLVHTSGCRPGVCVQRRKNAGGGRTKAMCQPESRSGLRQIEKPGVQANMLPTSSDVFPSFEETPLGVTSSPPCPSKTRDSNKSCRHRLDLPD